MLDRSVSRGDPRKRPRVASGPAGDRAVQAPGQDVRGWTALRSRGAFLALLPRRYCPRYRERRATVTES
jgi:hypothetical protein